MKKLLIGLAICLMIAGCRETAKAEVNIQDVLNKLPANHQCLIFNIQDSKFDYATTFTLAKVWKDKISFDLGYAPSSQLLGAVSIKLVEVKDWIKWPVLDLLEIEPMVWVGTNRIENFKDTGEYRWGVGVKLLQVKF